MLGFQLNRGLVQVVLPGLLAVSLLTVSFEAPGSTRHSRRVANSTRGSGQAVATRAGPSGPPVAASTGRRPAEAPLRPYQLGRATWYGTQFHGRITANGEQFDMFKMTAAHQDLPMGSHVRVTHLRSQRSVVVRITDRGPNTGKAIIDLSYGAARELRLLESGVFAVRLDLATLPMSEPVRTPTVGDE